MSELSRFLEVLFIKDDMARWYANESLDKRRQPLLEWSISGRHQGHYLSLLAQSYTVIPKNLRRQVKAIFVWYPKKRADLKTIHDENDVLTDHELVIVRGILRKSKHACLYIRNEFSRGFRLLNHVWGAYFKWTKWTHLNVSIYFSIYCDNHNTRWIRSFPHQQTWLVLQWKISCCSHIWDKCATSFQGLPVVFQAAL